MTRKPAQKKPTGWNRPLAYPLELRDGHEIETMKQAAGLITKRLPKARQEKPVWQYARELLTQAHKSGKREDVRAATDQLHRALIFEGWMT